MDIGNIDLDAYYTRIQYKDDAVAGLPALVSLQYAHNQAIAFENLDPFLGRRVSLALPDLQTKLINDQRGGYCYEHNLLFGAVLTQLGFDVRGLAARVVMGTSRPVAPKTHMLLTVSISGVRYIVDVGFGGSSPTMPLQLDTPRAQPTRHGTYRVRQQGNKYFLELLKSDDWDPLYQFDLTEMHPADYEPMNHYMGARDDSPFCTGLLVALVDGDTRLSLRDHVFSVRDAKGQLMQQRTLRDATELIDTLHSSFNIVVPDMDALRKAWESRKIDGSRHELQPE